MTARSASKVAGATRRAVRIAVISDLHAFDRTLLKTDAPSFYDISSTGSDPLKNPPAGLLHLIRQEQLSADILIVAGDLCDKAHPTGLRHAWAWIQDCGRAMGASLIASTPGNHDMDSRHIYNDYDARGVLLNLSPRFPLPTESDATNDRFWARNFVGLDHNGVRLVLLNSAAYHGGQQDEIKHGRLSDNTLTELGVSLQTSKRFAINILVCHHHPKQHHELGTIDDYEQMKNGDQLLELLGNGNYGHWIVVHGHRHYPKLEYSSGGSTSPLIFAAGSLCAVIYPEIQGRARNQFYIMHLDEAAAAPQGYINAWDWSLGQGWLHAQRRGSGIPYRAGFGWRGSIPKLADDVNRAVIAPYVDWESVTMAQPDVNFLLPSDLDALAARLETHHKVHVAFGDDGVPIQLGRLG
jgi:predicted phosphodiesterase